MATTCDYNDTTCANPVADRLSEGAYLATGIYLVIVGFLSTMGNSLVLAVILRDRKLRTKPHNMLIVNLAVADLSISFFGYPLTTISGFYSRWIFPDIACTITGFFSFLLSLCSMNTLACVSVYRYIIVCDPCKRKYLNIQNTKYVIACTWIHATIWTGLPLLGWGGYALEPFGTSCSLDWGNRQYNNITYLICTIISCYCIHVYVMAKCYYRIVETTKKLQIWGKNYNRNLQTMTDVMWIHKVNEDKHVTIMCIVVVSMFLIIWTPYAVICFFYIIFPDMPLELTTLPTMICKAGCMMNPIIYFCTNHQFREACRQFYCFCLYRKVGSATVATCTRKYDEVTKEGIYVGRGAIQIQEDPSMF